MKFLIPRGLVTLSVAIIGAQVVLVIVLLTIACLMTLAVASWWAAMFGPPAINARGIRIEFPHAIDFRRQRRERKRKRGRRKR